MRAGFLLLLFFAGPASAESSKTVIKQSVAYGVYHVDGSFIVEASSAGAWNVLSDYDRIGDFVSSMRYSAVKERRTDRILVEQTALGRAFFVSRQLRVLLEVHEEPYLRITFKDISGKDFELYQGSWTLQGEPAGLKVLYHLEAKPRMRVPRFAGRRAFKTNALHLLNEVRSEVLRRDRNGFPP